MKKEVTTSQMTTLQMLRWLSENYTFGRTLDARLQTMVRVDPLSDPPPGLAASIRGVSGGSYVTFVDAQHGYTCVIRLYVARQAIVEIGCRTFKNRKSADLAWDRKTGKSSSSSSIRSRRHELIAWIAEVCAYRNWKW